MSKSQTQTVVSPSRAAAMRATETRTYNIMRDIRTMLAKSKLSEVASHRDVVLAAVDAQLAIAAPKPKAKAKKSSAKPDMRLAAYKAHRTMWQQKLRTARGKAKAEVLAKIAHYDALIAKPVTVKPTRAAPRRTARTPRPTAPVTAPAEQAA